MEKYKIIFLPESYKDLDEIFDYILIDSTSNAQNMLDSIINAISNLENFPLSGKRLIHKSLDYYHFRMLIVDPYIVFYRFVDDTIYIYRVLHGARDYIDALENI